MFMSQKRGVDQQRRIKMKTLKKKKDVVRMPDDLAANLVKKNTGWNYCPKSECRKQEAKEAEAKTKKNKKKENKK